MSRTTHNVATWFEIPTRDLARAASFYGTVLALELEISKFGPLEMAVFPVADGAPRDVVHGALVFNPQHHPSDSGPLVYLNGGADLDVPLARVEAAGGKVVMPKTPIGEHGFMAIFTDTEGNRLALHSFT